MKTTIFGQVFLGLMSVLLGVCYGGNNKKALTSLPPSEIRQYEGQALTSVKDYPETSIAGPQKVSLDSYRLKITGLVDHPLELTYDQALAKDHFSKVVTLHCVEGWDATLLWEGVLLEGLLAEAGVKRDAVVVIFHGADGDTSSLPLEYVRANKILLAYKLNGLTLSPGRGFPFQVVAESKWGYKWVKWVTEIELSANAGYRGYWESQGFSNNGNQTGPITE